MPLIRKALRIQPKLVDALKIQGVPSNDYAERGCKKPDEVDFRMEQQILDDLNTTIQELGELLQKHLAVSVLSLTINLLLSFASVGRCFQ